VILAALCAALAGCGSGASHQATSTTAASRPVSVAAPIPRRGCSATVLADLNRVIRRVYHEGIGSERTAVARRAIAASAALRAAFEAGDPVAAKAAVRRLVAHGHMTDLMVMRGSHVLARAGGTAVAPISGVVTGGNGQPIGTYVASVWSDEGLLQESDGLAEARLALRVGGRSVGGSLRLPAGHLPSEGRIVIGHVPYAYTSFAATAYPAGAMRVYIVRSLASMAHLCGKDSEQTTVNTLSRVAHLIYEGEAGQRTRPQVLRVQRDPALLAAVARRDPLAARQAVESLLNQHIVRLRVALPGGALLTDVGGPYVLAPVSAPLRRSGRSVGRFTLSIQDDEGYMRLARRLAGLKVLMYMGSQLVKNSLGPEPPPVPDSGRYGYRGASYRVYTIHARAFPSGPLTIHVLIPLPYA
jgi:hypothetical protein